MSWHLFLSAHSFSCGWVQSRCLKSSTELRRNMDLQSKSPHRERTKSQHLVLKNKQHKVLLPRQTQLDLTANWQYGWLPRNGMKRWFHIRDYCAWYCIPQRLWSLRDFLLSKGRRFYRIQPNCVKSAPFLFPAICLNKNFKITTNRIFHISRRTDRFRAGR